MLTVVDPDLTPTHHLVEVLLGFLRIHPSTVSHERNPNRARLAVPNGAAGGGLKGLRSLGHRDLLLGCFRGAGGNSQSDGISLCACAARIRSDKVGD